MSWRCPNSGPANSRHQRIRPRMAVSSNVFKLEIQICMENSAIFKCWLLTEHYQRSSGLNPAHLQGEGVTCDIALPSLPRKISRNPWRSTSLWIEMMNEGPEDWWWWCVCGHACIWCEHTCTYVCIGMCAYERAGNLA